MKNNEYKEKKKKKKQKKMWNIHLFFNPISKLMLLED